MFNLLLQPPRCGARVLRGPAARWTIVGGGGGGVGVLAGGSPLGEWETGVGRAAGPTVICIQTNLVNLKRKIDDSLDFWFYQFTLAIQVESVVDIVVVMGVVMGDVVMGDVEVLDVLVLVVEVDVDMSVVVVLDVVMGDDVVLDVVMGDVVVLDVLVLVVEVDVVMSVVVVLDVVVVVLDVVMSVVVVLDVVVVVLDVVVILIKIMLNEWGMKTLLQPACCSRAAAAGPSRSRCGGCLVAW